MKKINKVIICFSIFLGMMFTFNANIMGVDKFPDTISPVRKDLITGKGKNLYKKEYSSTDPKNAGKAFCTRFNAYAPTGGTCRKTGWSSKTDISEKVSVAIGSLIAKARPSSGAMSWDSYYYAELAINQFLYNGYTGKKGYGVSYNSMFGGLPSQITNNSTFKSLLATAEYEYNNYKNTKVAISSTKYDENSRTATAVVTCSDYQGKKTACNISDKKVTATLNNNNISGINLTATKNSDNQSYTLKAVLPEIARNDGTLKIAFSVTDKHCWNTAQNYNCGDAYQSLTPNLLKPVCYNKNATANITKTNDPDYSLLIRKVSIVGSEESDLEGAIVTITKDGQEYKKEVPLTKITVDGQTFAGVKYNNIDSGRYCVTETKSPTGYKISSTEHCVTVGNPNTTSGAIENAEIKIINEEDKQNLTINKVDENGEPVVGAELKLYYVNTVPGDSEQASSSSDDDDAVVDATSNDITVVEVWVTDGNPKVIEGLEVGKTYTVSEEKKPEGYSIGKASQDITITEGDNVVTLENTHSKITVSKQSITSSKELPGAKLTITDAQGTVVQSWTSTEKPQEITGLSDGDYTLTETTAPQGYTVAESIRFTIEGGKLKDDADNTLVMKDATIVEVPDTFNIQNIIAMIAGVVLVGLGTGVLFYETKKKKA